MSMTARVNRPARRTHERAYERKERGPEEQDRREDDPGEQSREDQPARAEGQGRSRACSATNARRRARGGSREDQGHPREENAHGCREAGEPRATSKTAQLIEMLKRTGGATLDQICTKFGWLPHTTRAMMSAGGSLTKKHGLTVMSEKGADRGRVYSIKA